MELRSAEIVLRSFKLTKALIKQAKRITSGLPPFFWKDGDVTDKCIGYVKGVAIGEDEYTPYLLFLHNDDLYMFGYPGYKGKAKQLYL